MTFHISKTPYRISFFGGGTDYAPWFTQHGGSVLSTSIDKYCYLSARFMPPFFSARHRIVWSHIENVQTINEILHPAIRGILKHLEFTDQQGLEIHYQGDLPARSGIGSSSSFVVGLLHALYSLRGQTMSQAEFARNAIHIESNVLAESVGWQDQIAAAVGGLNHIVFNKDQTFDVTPVRASKARIAELEGQLLLFYTGESRMGTEIAGNIIKNIPDREAQLKGLSTLVDKAVSIVEGTDSLATFGEMLAETWRLKRGLSDRITTDRVDRLYDRAMAAGALGGKLLGAGGGGFILLFVPFERQAALRMAMDDLLEVPFRFEFDGTAMLYDAADLNTNAPTTSQEDKVAVSG